jgi:hypothetical protein
MLAQSTGIIGKPEAPNPGFGCLFGVYGCRVLRHWLV